MGTIFAQAAQNRLMEILTAEAEQALQTAVQVEAQRLEDEILNGTGHTRPGAFMGLLSERERAMQRLIEQSPEPTEAEIRWVLARAPEDPLTDEQLMAAAMEAAGVQTVEFNGGGGYTVSGVAVTHDVVDEAGDTVTSSTLWRRAIEADWHHGFTPEQRMSWGNSIGEPDRRVATSRAWDEREAWKELGPDIVQDVGRAIAGALLDYAPTKQAAETAAMAMVRQLFDSDNVPSHDVQYALCTPMRGNRATSPDYVHGHSHSINAPEMRGYIWSWPGNNRPIMSGETWTVRNTLVAGGGGDDE